MISKEEITKLADLARIDIKDEEVESLRGEMDSILNYVKLVQQFHSENTSGESDVKTNELRNVMRDDESASWPTTESETYSKELIAEFPESERNYLKVKKIL
jgi:aspartyl-tRNA(Asn)/glutamyl-tRNA(Gln) amidotransferase subunit C